MLVFEGKPVSWKWKSAVPAVMAPVPSRHVESDLDVAKPGVFGAGNWRVFIGRGQVSCHHDW